VGPKGPALSRFSIIKKKKKQTNKQTQIEEKGKQQPKASHTKGSSMVKRAKSKTATPILFVPHAKSPSSREESTSLEQVASPTMDHYLNDCSSHCKGEVDPCQKHNHPNPKK
jgi:hypothetical protein